MATPADGQRPRMRMYRFPNLANHLEIQAPAGIAGKKRIGVSQSGFQVFDVTAEVVMATFSDNTAACQLTNATAVAGKLAMFNFQDNGACSSVTRFSRLQAAGAAGVIMVYLHTDPDRIANITGFNAALTTSTVTVLSWNNAQPIKDQLAAGNAVTARAFRLSDRDGALDNQIVAHEWGHYISNRLIGNAAGLVTNHSRGMGEGWGDFVAMMLTVREDDTAVPSNATFNGAYALATYATSGVPFDGSPNHGYYFGIRRYPYSTDMTKNPLTFKHIQDGVALPVGPPLAFGADGAANSEVHNTGEVWTTMLWECYASILQDTLGPTPRLTFDEAQTRMKRYLTQGMMLTPLSPTFTEARDGVLAAANATDVADYVACQRGFAKRGARWPSAPTPTSIPRRRRPTPSRRRRRRGPPGSRRPSATSGRGRAAR